MTRISSNDPFQTIPRAERRRWQTVARRVERDHERDQLKTLQGLAARGVAMTGVVTQASSPLTDTVEMTIDGRRVRAHRVHRPTLAALKDALGAIASLPLAAVTRYGSYWVLTFKTATEPLVVLVDRLQILPDWGGGLSWSPVPSSALNLVG